MKGTAAFVVLVAISIAALTWVLGWWGVLVGALVAGFAVREQRGGGWRVAMAASLGWGALLLIDAASGSLAPVASTLAAVTRLPTAALVGLTLIFPALLAWSAATVAAATRQLRR